MVTLARKEHTYTAADNRAVTTPVFVLSVSLHNGGHPTMLSVQEEMRGRVYAFNRRDIEVSERASDGKVTRHTGKDIKAVYGERMSWMDHAKKLSLAQDNLRAVVGSSNLLFNDHVVAWVRDKSGDGGRLYFPLSENVSERIYDAFVGFEDGTVDILSVKFEATDGNFLGNIKILRASRDSKEVGQSLSTSAVFAVSGQLLVQHGQPHPTASIWEQWCDLRWVFKFPFVKVGDIDGFFGLDQLLDNSGRSPGELAMRAMKGEAVTLDTSLHGRPLDRETLTNALSDPEASYVDVTGTDSANERRLETGEYKWLSDKNLLISLRPGRYPHNVVGVTRAADGVVQQVKVLQVTGKSGRVGATLEELKQLLVEEGVSEAIVLDNGEDVKMQLDGEMVNKGAGDRSRHFAALGFYG